MEATGLQVRRLLLVHCLGLSEMCSVLDAVCIRHVVSVQYVGTTIALRRCR
jgi:hypothetical protein